MYYRGTRVPLSEKSPRFHTVGLNVSSGSARFRKKEEKSFFLSWGSAKEKPVTQTGTKNFSFYRPGKASGEVRESSSSPFLRGKGHEARPQAMKGTGLGWKWPGLGVARVFLRIGTLVLLVGLVVWSKNKIAVFLQDVAGLRLEKVTVEGNHYLSEDEIVRTVDLAPGESMFKLDLKEAGDRVRKMDWVERVFVERRLPRTILVSVRERKPLALLDNGSLFGVDRDGRVLSPSQELMHEDLPLISGIALRPDAVGTTSMAESLKPAIDFFTFLQRRDAVLAQDVSEVNLSEPEALKVTFIDGIQAKFDSPMEEDELKRMTLVLSDLGIRGKHAGSMDFRYRGMVLVKAREP